MLVMLFRPAGAAGLCGCRLLLQRPVELRFTGQTTSCLEEAAYRQPNKSLTPSWCTVPSVGHHGS